jgi:hypothetical protein
MNWLKSEEIGYMETVEHSEWTVDKITALKKLIRWYEGLPPGTEVRIYGGNDSVPVESILDWLRMSALATGYNEMERSILNDLVQVRKEWMDDTIGA